MRYAIVINGIVDNVIEWDGVTPWTPDQGTVVLADQAGPGDLWDGKVFTRLAPVVTAVIAKVSLADRVAALEQQIAVMRPVI